MKAQVYFLTQNIKSFFSVIALISAFTTTSVNADTQNQSGMNSTATTGLQSKEELKRIAHSKITKVTVDSLETMKEKDESFILVDIRTEKEFKAGHIEGAVWIPRGFIEFRLRKLTMDPDANVILYCKNGGRSALSVVAMMNMGHKNIHALKGGFQEWAETKKPIFNIHGAFTLESNSFQKEEERKIIYNFKS